MNSFTSRETWKPVIGYEGLYEVSSLGRVRGCDRITPHGHRRRGALMSLCLDHGGYQIIGLCKDGKRTTKKVHALVLEAFVGPRPSGACACHFPDRDKKNNSLSNLRWDSYVGNFVDREKHGKTARGERHGIAKLTSDLIPSIRRDVENVRMGRKKARNGAMKAIEKRYGVTQGVLLKIARRQSWGHIP